MKLRTSEELQQLFFENKLRHQKMKEEENERRQQKLKFKKMAAKLLKKVDREVFKMKMDNIKAEMENTSQKPQKLPQIKYYKQYERPKNNLFGHEDSLYLTREELKEAETRYEGEIDWKKWDELVSKTRQNIIGETINYVVKREIKPHNYKPVEVYIYNSRLQFVGHYHSCFAAAKYYGVNNETIRHLLKTGQPHKKLGITVLDKLLSN